MLATQTARHLRYFPDRYRYINNPNAINPIFLLAERERIACRKMAGGTLALPGEKEEMPVPHVLKDGADSIGVAGATIRVYVNIACFPNTG